MSWIELVIWILVVFGASNGVAHSNLLKPFRVWTAYKISKVKEDDEWKDQYTPRKNLFLAKLITCVMCLGFWFGLLAGLLWVSPSQFWLTDAFLGSSTSWILYLTIKDKQEQS